MKRKYLEWVPTPFFKLFPELAMTYRFFRISWRLRDEPGLTPMGFKFVGDQTMQDGQFEPVETQVVNCILPSVDVLINVGANIGYYCCLALSKNREVVAFEPVNLNLRYLLRNVKANNWESRIEVFPMALSDKVGVIDIFGEGTGASLVKGWADTPEEYATSVPCTTLDNVLGSRFQGKRCLIIIDIEGAERSMLEGSRFIINMDPKPLWMIEITITEHQPKGVNINPNLLSTFQIFWDNGYEARTIDDNYRLINSEEIEEIIKSGKDTIKTHNFLFVEKGRWKELSNNLTSS